MLQQSQRFPAFSVPTYVGCYLAAAHYGGARPGNAPLAPLHPVTCLVGIFKWFIQPQTRLTAQHRYLLHKPHSFSPTSGWLLVVALYGTFYVDPSGRPHRAGHVPPAAAGEAALPRPGRGKAASRGRRGQGQGQDGGDGRGGRHCRGRWRCFCVCFAGRVLVCFTASSLSRGGSIYGDDVFRLVCLGGEDNASCVVSCASAGGCGLSTCFSIPSLPSLRTLRPCIAR